MLDDFGSISVRAYTASGALPVADATVRISGAEEANRDVIHSLITDRDGITPTVILPAPLKEFSETPNPREAPYAIYDIEVSKDGYFTKKIDSVPIFSGVYSLQPVSMIPDGQNVYDIPKNNLNTTIPQSNLN